MFRSRRSAESRDQLLIFGTWLVGLGVVFLVRELTGWEWTQAWPMFVILVGVASTVSALVASSWSRHGMWAAWWPLALVVVGIVLLAATTGALGIDTADLGRWWPLGVIALGGWFLIGALLAGGGSSGDETLDVPLAGLSEAEIRLNYGGGELRVGPAQPGTLLSGTFDGGVVRRDRGPGSIELRPADPGIGVWSGRPRHWNLALSTEIPIDLRLDSGANRAQIDLSSVRVRRLELHTGASETFVRLPAHGATTVLAEAGVAALNIEVPAGVAARIRSSMGLGMTRIDENRFPPTMGGWQSADYDSAANRVEIEIKGGLGSIQIG